jgi:AICAR transformylase/IMP cyclohydrolase PurH
LLSRIVDDETATALADLFVEAIIVPDTGEAVEIFKRKKNLRVYEVGEPGASQTEMEVRRVSGSPRSERDSGASISRIFERSPIGGSRSTRCEH